MQTISEPIPGEEYVIEGLHFRVENRISFDWAPNTQLYELSFLSGAAPMGLEEVVAPGKKWILRFIPADLANTLEVDAIQQLRSQGHVMKAVGGIDQTGSIWVASVRYDGDLFQLPRALSPREAIDACRQLIEGLASFHGLGWIHGDFKMENNYFMFRDGAIEYVIGDLGSVCQTSDPQRWSTTEFYLSPELREQPPKEMDPSDDIWALGIVMYALLYGESPIDVDHHLLYHEHRLNQNEEELFDEIFCDRKHRINIHDLLRHFESVFMF